MSERERLNDCDSEPVTYCSRCYSLKIIYEDAIGADCCGDCGCSDIQTADFEDWNKLYIKRYGHPFVTESSNVKNSPIFQLSIDKLKTVVYNHPEWKKICKDLYPSFPDGYSRIDSVLLLFSRLCKDNKIENLRYELLKRSNKIKKLY